MLWWIWVIFGLLLLALELATPGGFYLLFFGASGVFIGLLRALDLSGPAWMQWLLFSIIAVIAMLLFRRPLLNKFRVTAHGVPVDSLVGEVALAMEDIAVNAVGKAEMRGTSWSARNVGAGTVTRGQRCQVEQVDGLVLNVRAR